MRLPKGDFRRLGDVVFFQEGPGLRTSQWTPEGMKVINGTNILADGTLDISNTDKYISEAEFEARYRHFAIAEGDLVLSSSGTLGKVGRIAAEHLPLMMNTSVIRFRAKDESLLDDRYLFAFLRSPHFQSAIKSFAVGGVQQNFGPVHLKQMYIPLPPLRRQRRIGEILSAYDELVQNNRRRLSLLETAAGKVFRSWFVRLRFPGSEHTKISNGLPVRWERRELGRCATFLSGGTPSKAREDFWNGEIPWASSGELTELRIADTPLKITAQAAEVGSRLVPRETILAVVRGMSLAKEWRISLTSREMAFNQDLKAIVANDDVDPLYLFHALDAQREQVRDRAGEASHGTKKLETAVLSALPILVPPHPLQMLFREHVEPMHALWDNLHRQNEILRAARDLLLPRLMSGELAV